MSSASYQIEWAAGALRSLDRLPEKIATACVEFVYGGLAASPKRGDFRVIYEIDESQRVVTVIAVDQRSDVYRRP